MLSPTGDNASITFTMGESIAGSSFGMIPSESRAELHIIYPWGYLER